MLRPDWNKLPEVDARIDKSKNEFINTTFNSRYPNDYECYKQISRIFNIPIQNLAIGFGSDDIIGRCFQLYNLDILDDDQYEMSYVYKNIFKSMDKICHGVYFGNPSNKNPNITSKHELIELLNDNIDRIYVIDEVYAGFNEFKYSLRFNIENYPNLIIIDSCSKSLGLPGIRCGFSIACKKLTKQIQNIRPSHICTEETINTLKQVNIKSIKKFRKNIMKNKILFEQQYDHIDCIDVPYSIITSNISELEKIYKGRNLSNGIRING